MTCNLCGSEQQERLDLGEPLVRTGAYVQCPTCGLIYHSLPDSIDRMRDFYHSEYAGEYSASEVISRELALARINRLGKARALASLSPALEIGCANGEFIHELAGRDVEVSGVEPSRAMSEHARDHFGLEVVTGLYEDQPEKAAHYRLIAMFHVLEHVVDPTLTLQRIHRELRPGGLLFIEVPTLGDCQLSMVFKPIHPTVFVRETLEAMLAKNGFESLWIDEKGYHLQVIARPMEGQMPVTWPDPVSIRSRIKRYLATRQNVMDRIVSTLQALVGQKDGAIYGAGLNTLDLDNLFPLMQLDLEAVYDADPAKWGKQVLGLEICPPSELEAWHGSYLIISSYAFQEEILEQLAHLEKRGVRLVTLYEKS
ncbi:class I SAM-dependent methyltransferase [Solemya velesiana gill symbiont]|uniref:C-methyltransferase domain-containing protein n=1 Tax=Solemya velesiana gill symbiont TaxID=1918948 RepID=A0A1T2KUD8_9GAMM|nr:class I SAM-dependent methyltransferase [Solemya velesiana gill symbiont]OOZ36444.1 hypothetical protein BOW51_07170 [Solemya velesiana gill symbiont]